MSPKRKLWEGGFPTILFKRPDPNTSEPDICQYRFVRRNEEKHSMRQGES